MKYLQGLVSGIFFGIAITLFAVFGLVSLVAALLGRWLAMPGILAGTYVFEFVGVVITVNAVLYGGIGYLIDRWSKDEPYFVPKIFAGILGLLVLLVLLEALLFGGLRA